MEGGYVENKLQWGDGGALGSASSDGQKSLRTALEEEPAFWASKETAYAQDDGSVSPLGSEGCCELVWFNILEPTLDVKKEGGDFLIQALKEADIIGVGCGGGEGGEDGEGTSLMRVENAAGPW